MLYVIQEGNSYILKFRYDPVLISYVKNVPGRQWNPKEKFWTIPKEHLGWLLNEIKGTEYENAVQIQSEENLNENASLDSTNSIPEIDISDMEQHVKRGYNLYSHQIDFLKYAKNRAGRGFILSDEQGLGKTLEVMNYALYMRKKYSYRHCLIITCVNSAKFSWQEDIFNHTNGMEQAYILGTRLKKNGDLKLNTTGADKVDDLKTGHMYGDISAPKLPYFLITNIESLRTKNGRKYTLAEEIINMAQNNELQMMPIDEVHKNMSPKSTQGKLILEIKKKTGNSIEWIPMTGTPIVNKPTDVYTPLKLVNGHSMKSYWLWCQQFCVFGGYGGHEIMAYKNIPYLKDMLQNNMLRRLKKDVLDLPPKIYYTEYVENTPVQQKLYRDIQWDMLEHKDEILESMNPLTEMLRLRQVNGCPELIDNNIKFDDKYLSKNAKLVRLLELVDEVVERGEKVVIFSNWVGALKPVYKFVSAKYKTACFTGSMSESDRQKHKRVFINNPDYKVMLGTVGALGVNHTLTAANNVIFADEPWTPADKVQCEDRTHRIGADAPVNIYTIITKGTIDETVHKIVYDKQDISNFIVDGKLDLRRNPELFEKLLGNSKI
ncbi:MAG: DEAD/DEAH box helicase [Clostridium sp.]|nr:DEAD/DEAH box helicase [Clostridium sp.]